MTAPPVPTARDPRHSRRAQEVVVMQTLWNHGAARPRSLLRRRVVMLAWIALALALGALAVAATPPVALAADDPATLIERGHYREARALLEQKLAANPNDATASVLMSKVRSAFGDRDDAMKLAENAVKLAPNDAKAHERLAMVLGDEASKASMLKAMGLAKRFRKEAEAAIAIDPHCYEAQSGLIQFYLRAPGIAGGDKKKAREKADEVAKLDALQGAYARASICEVMKDSAGAFAQYVEAAKVAPNDYGAHINLAAQYARAHDDDAALREALAAQKLDPGRIAAYSLLAQVHARAGRWTDMDAAIAEAATAVPGNLGPSYQAGRMLVVLKKEPARAEALIRPYLAAEVEGGAPDHAAARWRLAQALDQQGKRDDAIAQLEAALKERPDFPDAKKDLKAMKHS